jgi:multiple sugar transport system substrate-binding protein
MCRVQLKGITWNHSRALPPLVATAQRFEELHPGVEIRWEKRSLHAFGHASLAELAQAFDLVVVDHPMMGDAESTGSLVDLTQLLDADCLKEMEDDSAGPSFASYSYRGKFYALPIDAAAPAASYRPDLLAKAGFAEPAQWSEVLDLATRGLVRMPGFPADLFLNFMGMCVSSGSTVAATPEALFDRAVALECLEQLRELAARMPAEIYEWNPIALYERLSTMDEFVYCPFAYTYSNYARAGFAQNPVRFALPPRLWNGATLRTVLGGTGLAISTLCAHPEVALKYSLYVAGHLCQGTLYGLNGGQPARLSAWEDGTLNSLSDDFFRRTLHSIETAYVRPRYCGYARFQEKAGLPMIDYLRNGSSANRALDQLDALYRESLPTGGAIA